jgi:hypothetical protein
MADVVSTIGEGFKQSFLMAYEVWWEPSASRTPLVVDSQPIQTQHGRRSKVCSGVVIPRGAYSVGSAEALPRLEL